MIDELINKQVEKFRKKFLKDGEINKDVVAYDLSNIEAHLVRSMEKVGEEIVEKIRNTKIAPHLPVGMTPNIDEIIWNDAIDKVLSSLTEKGNV